MKTILTSVFLFLALNASARQESAKPAFLRILSYEQVQKLHESSRDQYVQSVAKAVTTLAGLKEQKYSFFEQLLSMGSIAYATPLYQCVGGGVPVDTKAKSCGVQSYAGFTCAAGKNICNPLIFGVNSSNGEPVCSERATTKWCYDNTKLGETQTLDPVFKANNVEEWDRLRGHLEQACNTPALIQENQNDVQLACGYVRDQMKINEDVRKLLAKGYTYKFEKTTKAAGPDKCDNCSAVKSPQAANLQSLQNASKAFDGFAAKEKVSLIAKPETAKFTIPNGKSFSGFYPGTHSYDRNGNSASIQGIKGQLQSPMPGCSSKNHYQHRGSGFHAAQDLVAPYKTPVQSVAPGVVVKAAAAGDGYGNSVIVMHQTVSGEVFYTGYHHLASISLRAGDRVDAGRTVGAMGNTGRSQGAHLHFEIMDKNQKRSNPLAYYPQGICSKQAVQSSSLASL